MSLPQPASDKSSKRTIWIIVIVAVVLLCCLAVILLAAGYFYVTKSGASISLFPTKTQPAAPTAAASAAAPTATSLPTAVSPLIVEPFDPTNSTYPTLAELVPGWSAATGPSTQTWSVYVTADEPVMIFNGWCTTTQDILAFNVKHITYKLIMDGQQVDVNSLYKWNSQESDRVCETWVGLIRQWPGTSHTILTTMTMDWALNDGWSDYKGGDYTDVYNVTVSP